MRTRGHLAFLTLSLALFGTLLPATSYAQRHARGPVRATRSVVVVGGHYSPWYYDPFYYPYWWYPSAFYGPLPPGYWGWGAADHRSAVRLQVTPKQAEVYVDGYLAGTVDDFDGTFQRLTLPPGDHEIILYLAGYRTVSQKIYLTVGSTYRIRYAMEPLAPGEPNEPRPVPPPSPQPRPAPLPNPRAMPPDVMPPPTPAPPPYQAPRIAVQPGVGFGSLSIRVQPLDAQVLIDGEAWQTSGTPDRLVVQVASGGHHVQVRLDGYQPFERDIQVQAGETVTVNVSLSKRD